MTAVQREIEGLPSLADIPPEIRFKIYNLIDQPRLVEIRYDEELSTVWSSTKGPLCMHICRESRRETERVYERCFAGRDGEANILFDFRCDVLYFGKNCIEGTSLDALAGVAIHFEATDGREVQHLAVHANVMQVISDQLEADVEFFEREGDSLWDAHLMVLPEFHNLELLTVVGPDDGTALMKYSMYCEMCERAKDEELGMWSMPLLGYIIEDECLGGSAPPAVGQGAGSNSSAGQLSRAVRDDIGVIEPISVEIIEIFDDEKDIMGVSDAESEVGESNVAEVIDITDDEDEIIVVRNALETASMGA